MQIDIINNLSEPDMQRLYHWRERVFPPEGMGYRWSAPRWHLILRDSAGAAAAHLGFEKFTVYLQATQRAVVGVGGVTVHPDYQGQGLTKTLFSTLHEHPYAVGISRTFALFCPERLTPLYQKFNYSVCQTPVTFLQEQKPVRNPFCLMVRGEPLSGDNVYIPSHPW